MDLPGQTYVLPLDNLPSPEALAALIRDDHPGAALPGRPNTPPPAAGPGGSASSGTQGDGASAAA
eukprot:6363320-Alexandrium_andersonii.AAC.1